MLYQIIFLGQNYFRGILSCTALTGFMSVHKTTVTKQSSYLQSIFSANTSTSTQLSFTHLSDALNAHQTPSRCPGLRSVTENCRGTKVLRDSI